MLCPECTARTRVIGTKTSFENERYRSCPSCGYSFTTVEKVKGIVKSSTFFLPKNQNTLKSVSNKPTNG